MSKGCRIGRKLIADTWIFSVLATCLKPEQPDTTIPAEWRTDCAETPVIKLKEIDFLAGITDCHLAAMVP